VATLADVQLRQAARGVLRDDRHAVGALPARQHAGQSRKAIAEKLGFLERQLSDASSDLAQFEEGAKSGGASGFIYKLIVREHAGLTRQVADFRARHDFMKRNLLVKTWLRLFHSVRRFLNRSTFQHGLLGERGPAFSDLLRSYRTDPRDSRAVDWSRFFARGALVTQDFLRYHSTRAGFPAVWQGARVARVGFAPLLGTFVLVIHDAFGARSYAMPGPDGGFRFSAEPPGGKVLMADGGAYR
jgi:hypothetical protein